MDRNGLLAIILCLGIFIVWGQLFPPPPQQQPSIVQSPTTQQETASENKNQPAKFTTQPGIKNKQEKKSSLSEDLVLIDNDYFLAKIGKQTGNIYSWKLKKYLDEDKKPHELVRVSTNNINHLSLSSQIFSPQFGNAYLSPFKLVKQNSDKLLFHYEDKNLKVDKEYIFNPSRYEVQVKVSAYSKKGLLDGHLGFSVSDRFTNQGGGFFSPMGGAQRVIIANSEGEIGSETLEAVQNGKEGLETFHKRALWIGSDEQYFISALVHQFKTIEETRLKFNQPKGWVDTDGSKVRAYLRYPLHEKETHFGFSLFMGPKDMDLLGEISPTLTGAIDYGWFRIIAMPLLWLLKQLYKFFQNYGIAIILLTAIVKVVFYPLTQKSFQSMKDMQRIQPQMAKIKDKYKDDKERMNREVMQLMKANKVNPMGGCLPMLLQMPVFFALYRVLGSSIELRGAPFFFWIQDLSMKDPWFITPVLTGGVMFIQQKITPTTADPAQAKMMMFMPIMFSGFLLYLPSGLTLYILCNTVLTIIQQYLINKQRV